MAQRITADNPNDLAHRLDVETDSSAAMAGLPPNYGEFVTPHMLSFQAIMSSVSKVYRPSDEALRNSWESAIAMRNDCGIMESLEARQRATALLPWEIEPEDSKDSSQKALCGELTKIIQRIFRFTEYRRNLLEGLWYGRYGVQNRYCWDNVGGRMRLFPSKLHDRPGWLPINGDKLVFRYDDGELSEKKSPNQLGIRVSSRYTEGAAIAQRWRCEKVADAFQPTTSGMAYFISDWERQIVTVHKHTIEDGDFYSSDHAGSIHGVGIRSRIYWDWFQKQECLAFLMEYLERSAGGIEIWDYPAGNDEAKRAVTDAATKRVSHGRNILINPKPPGEDAALFGVQIVEPGMAGIDALKDLLVTFFGHRIKRYILGQVLSSKAAATGLGSGVAELHLDTFLQIVEYDGRNLEETLTEELVRQIQRFNFSDTMGCYVRFKIKTRDEDMQKKLESLERAWQMGARITERAVHDAVGAQAPTADDIVLPSPSQNAAATAAASMPPIGMDAAGQPGVAGGATQPVPAFVSQHLDHKRDELKNAVRTAMAS